MPTSSFRTLAFLKGRFPYLDKDCRKKGSALNNDCWALRMQFYFLNAMYFSLVRQVFLNIDTTLHALW